MKEGPTVSIEVGRDGEGRGRSEELKGDEETYIGPSGDLDDKVEDGLGLISKERDVAAEGKEGQ
jgi:hypothetical protein